MTPITVTLDPRFQVWKVCSPQVKGIPLPILGHVFVHPAGYLLASDRHVGVIARCSIEGAEAGWEGALIPADFLAKVGKASKGHATLLISGDELRCETRGAIFLSTTGAGKYPALHKIFTSALTAVGGAAAPPAGFVARFNAEQQERLACALGGAAVVQQWSADPAKTILVYGDPGDEAFGVLMPLNPTHATAPQPKESQLRAALQALAGEPGGGGGDAATL